jgi:hypothetical protein
MSDTRRNIVYSSDRDSVADGNRFDLPSTDKTIASLVVGGFGRGANTTAWPARVCVLRPCKAQPSCTSIRKYQHEQASRRFHRL